MNEGIIESVYENADKLRIAISVNGVFILFCMNIEVMLYNDNDEQIDRHMRYFNIFISNLAFFLLRWIDAKSQRIHRMFIHNYD